MGIFEYLNRKYDERDGICDAVIRATDELVRSRVLQRETRLTPVLEDRTVRQYIAGTLLNVICYASKSSGNALGIEARSLAGHLKLKCGRYGIQGFNNAEELAKQMKDSNAPAVSMEEELPIVSRCIVAEMCIDAWLQGAVPRNEFDVFRREFLASAQRLWDGLFINL